MLEVVGAVVGAVVLDVVELVVVELVVVLVLDVDEDTGAVVEVLLVDEVGPVVVGPVVVGPVVVGPVVEVLLVEEVVGAVVVDEVVTGTVVVVEGVVVVEEVVVGAAVVVGAVDAVVEDVVVVVVGAGGFRADTSRMTRFVTGRPATSVNNPPTTRRSRVWEMENAPQYPTTGTMTRVSSSPEVESEIRKRRDVSPLKPSWKPNAARSPSTLTACTSPSARWRHSRAPVEASKRARGPAWLRGAS